MGTPSVCDNYLYKMDRDHRGYFLIIGVEIFHYRQFSRRIGNELDMERLEETFGNLGFRTIRAKRNPTSTEMLTAVEKLAALDHRDNDCVGVAIMSHGELDSDGDDIVYGRDCLAVKLMSLLAPLSGKSDLQKKPKLIFVQACRGHELDHGKKVPANQNNGNSEEDEIEDRNIPIIDNPDGTFLDNFPRVKNLFGKDKDTKSRKMLADVDFLIHYSTPRGYYSWRSQRYGSIFIQTVCKVLEDYTNRKDGKQQLSDLLTEVNRKVASDYVSKSDELSYNECKLMPVLMIKLRKGIVFPSGRKTPTLPHPVEVNSDLSTAFQQMRLQSQPTQGN